MIPTRECYDPQALSFKLDEDDIEEHIHYVAPLSRRLRHIVLYDSEYRLGDRLGSKMSSCRALFTLIQLHAILNNLMLGLRCMQRIGS